MSGAGAGAAADRAAFVGFFPQVLRDLTADGLQHPEVGDAVARLKEILEYNTPGGKYNRGLTVLAAFRELVGPEQQDPENFQCALTVGWCIELLQAFFLVADDIMDFSLTRRGQPCWYKKEGIGLDAVNDSFLLESCIYQLLKKYCRGKPYYVHLLELFLQAGIDSEEEHANAKAILLEMGEFFQIQDDFLDCFGDPNLTGKLGTDIQDNKCSWLVVECLHRVSPEQRQLLEENYGQKEPEKVAKVKELYETVGMRAAYQECEEISYRRLEELVEKHANRLPKAIFLGLAQKIYKRQK
ncbi:farnesyl pyrophosphate synthase isoform X2 [Chrysemys picta bellii]|uniref:farnesyl pyrophosphate synthase isoform X2 n=1 Tax=Chrysemys picta bellii TaxID=8478 RepID=UPI001C6663C2|nr:farnesyl pyrophosphate synthase isoform X2 [Chrysemys picta bellii]